MPPDSLDVYGRRLAVDNMDKVLFPDAGYTKGDLVDYYTRIAEVALPYLRDRPVAVRRFPDGLDEAGFFQKNADQHVPAWVERAHIEKVEGGTLEHLVIDEPATLAFLAGQAAIELHPWLARAHSLEHPDQLILDLDPPSPSDTTAARDAAHRVHELLDELGLISLVKTSGSKGFHIHVPLAARASFDRVRDIARSIATLAARRHPDQLTTAHRIEDRGRRVFVDHLRNAYGQTAVAPYSVRAKPGAPVATPLRWDELTDVEPQSYTLANLFRRLGQTHDPWQQHRNSAQRLDHVHEKLRGLTHSDG